MTIMIEMTSSFFIQKKMFFMSLYSSMIICLSSSSFLSMWMSMEINLFSFIPLMTMNQKFYSEKATMMYFLIQSLSSSIIIMSMSLNLNSFKSMANYLILMAIFIKLGMFPFHYWMISVIEGVEWNTALLLMTIQKIIPISILMIFIHEKTIIFLCMINSFIMAMSGITMFSVRKILGFSSINHLSMMLIAMTLSKKIFKMYFLVYSAMTLSATKSMKFMNMNFIFQKMTILKNEKINNTTSLILFMSMAGIPPFLGFMPKMITILFMLKSYMILTVLIIILSNTVSTYFYLRMSLNNILMNLNLKKVTKPKVKVTIPHYLIFSPIYMTLMWNFKLSKLLIFKIKIKVN